MHNESQAERQATEPSKPSKLKKIKDNLVTVGMIAIPVAVIGTSMYLGVKTTKIQLDIAKLNLETAKLNKS